MMPRKYHDSRSYSEEKAKLLKPDNIHCIRCGGEIPKEMRAKGRRMQRYCSLKCSRWADEVIQDWSKIRAKVLERDGHACQRCGARETRRKIPWHEDQVFPLEVHHIKSIKDGGPEFDEANCITLCHDCHSEEHFEIDPIRKMHRTLDSFLKTQGG
ncbi:MAG TPA: HNH endonuclease [Methanotrichaceae archaeon]|nr:HNH endonuclease [Methanotrichaceae archaeon]